MNRRVLIKDILKFVVPYTVWLFIFKDLLIARAVFVGDAYSVYALVKFFLENFSRGVFPLWNPFLLWGCPDLIINNFFGVFNPLWMLTLGIHKLGFHYYFAFTYTVIFYFFFGVFGFYLFAKALLKDSQGAYICFLMILFSMQTVFSNFMNGILVYVPIAWFFYFWIRFYQAQEKKFFVGLIFTTMIIMTTYFPPYWLTLCCFALIAFALCDFHKISKTARPFAAFLRQHFFMIMVCFVIFLTAVFPSFRAFQMSSDKEVAFVDRHKTEDGRGFLEKGGEMSPEELAVDSFGFRQMADHLFTNLDLRGYRREHNVIPIFAIILFFLGAFTRITRRTLPFFILFICLLFILAGPSGGFYVVFYYVLPLFRVIHSLSSFWLPLIAVFILYAILQWQEIARDQFNVSKRLKIFILLFVHIGFLVFLIHQGNNLITSYLTIVLSLIYFSVLFFLEKRIFRFVVFFLLAACVLIQPVEALWRYSQDACREEEFIQQYIFPKSQGPQFVYIRPQAQGPDTRDNHIRHQVMMKDYIRFMGLIQFPSRWTAYLSSCLPRETVEKYVQYKFYVYDYIVALSGTEEKDLKLAEEIFRKNLNLSLVSVGRDETEGLKTFFCPMEKSLLDLGTATPISGPTPQFRVIHFDVNAISFETDFEKEKFLVYNDSYQKDWQLFVNGKRKKFYRANVAFKGIVLPAGKNIVSLVYAPLGGAKTYFVIWAIFLGMFLWTIFLFLKDERKTRGSE